MQYLHIFFIERLQYSQKNSHCSLQLDFVATRRQSNKQIYKFIDKFMLLDQYFPEECCEHFVIISSVLCYMVQNVQTSIYFVPLILYIILYIIEAFN